MKLAAVYFDDNVVIPGAKDTGGGMYQDLRESCFHAVDGWTIRRHCAQVYSLWREGMSEPAFVEGYGSTFRLDVAPNTEAEAWASYAKPEPEAKRPRKAKP